MAEPAQAAQATPGSVWSFGEAVFDERAQTLLVRGQPVEVEAKPLELLTCLLAHPGEVVTKDELLEQVWAGRIPSESVLTKAMAKLRQALGDEEQALIKTVYGYGYRLVAVTRERREPTPLPTPAFAAGDHPPQRPNWKLERQLGGGGSEVWLARHAKTGEARVFKFARDAEALRGLKREITLFRVLQQALGERPDRLRLHDWNLEEAPYFLEQDYVTGGNLPQWIESAGGWTAVPLALRLELVAQTAEALSAAHDAGVLHKDLKPANLLVDPAAEGGPQIKLVDFGSGRLVDFERLHQLEITRLGFTQTVAAGEETSGTPLYLAPELLGGQPPTARSDIYALGVLLYQLLAEDLRRPLAPGWERDIEDPLLREDIAACADLTPQRRLADAGELARRLRGVDERRREAAQAAAERTRAEATQRAMERFRARRTGFVVALAVLLLGLAASLTLYFDARRTRLRAEAAERSARHEAEVSRQVGDFVVSLFEAANPGRGRGRVIDARTLVDEGKARLAGRFAGQPTIEARMLGAVGTLYCQIGLYEQCRLDLERALEVQARAADAEPLVTAELQLQLASAYLSQLRNRDSERMSRLALDGMPDSLPPEAPQRVRGVTILAESLIAEADAGQDREALKLLEPLRDRLRVAGQGETMEMSRLLRAQFEAYRHLSMHREALQALDESTRILRAQGAANPGDELQALNARVELLNDTDRVPEAVQTGREILAQAIRLYGEDSQQVGEYRVNLGAALKGTGQLLEAQTLVEQGLEGYRQSGNAGTADYRWALGHLASIQLQRGDYALAVEHYRSLGRSIHLGNALTHLGRTGEAFPLLEPEVPETDDGLDSRHQQLLRLDYLAHWYAVTGNFALADAYYDRLDTAIAAMPFPQGNILRRRAIGRPLCLVLQKRYREALPLLQALVPEYTGRYGADSPYTLVAAVLLAETLLENGQAAEARTLAAQIAPAVARELLPAHRERRRFESLRAKLG